MLCWDCQYMYKCPACDVSLGVHSHPEQLLCHHCWYHENIPLSCTKCNSTQLKKIWVWTQQIEKSITSYFKDIKIFRFDSDSTNTVVKKRETLYNIEISDIIIGTKMITTGFDFQNIGLIGIILLEQELQIPRYDTEEKIYSNIKQLIGRGGRSWTHTDIVIQTHIPNNPIIQNIVEWNYKDFFKKTLQERKIFWYPPYVEMAILQYKHKDIQSCKTYLAWLVDTLKTYPHSEIEITFVDQIFKRDHQYFWRIFLQWKDIRIFLQNIKSEILKNKDLWVIFE